MAALASTPQFVEQRKRQVEYVSDRLCQKIRYWLGPKVLSAHFQALQDKVVEPAAQLLHTITCSSKQYEFTLRRSEYSAGYFPMSAMDHEFIDLTSWRVVNPDRLVNCIAYLYPGIRRKAADSQADLVLAKPVLLGYPKDAPPPSVSPSRAPMAKAASEHRRYDKRRQERDTTDRRGHSSPRQSPQKESSSRRSTGEPKVEKQKTPGTTSKFDALTGFLRLDNRRRPSASSRPGGQPKASTFPQGEHEHGAHRAETSTHDLVGSGLSRGERDIHYLVAATAPSKATIEPSREHTQDMSSVQTSYQYETVDQWSAPHQG